MTYEEFKVELYEYIRKDNQLFYEEGLAFWMDMVNKLHWNEECQVMAMETFHWYRRKLKEVTSE